MLEKIFEKSPRVLLIMFIISGLYNLGYWSTFEVNILTFYSVSELLLAFMFPFFSSMIYVFIFLLIFDYLLILAKKIKNKKFNKGEEYEEEPKYLGLIITIATFLMTIILSIWLYFNSTLALIIIPLVWAIIIVYPVYFSFVKAKLIKYSALEHEYIKYIIFTLLLSFFVGKFNSKLISNNIIYDYQIVSQGSDLKVNKYLGKAGSFYFFSDIDNNNLIIQPISSTESKTIYHFSRWQLNNKRDSILYKFSKPLIKDDGRGMIEPLIPPRG